MATNEKTAAPAPSMTVFDIANSLRRALSDAFDANTALSNTIEKFPNDVEPGEDEIAPQVAVEAYTHVMDKRLLRLLDLLDTLDAHPASSRGGA
jgi:hypothetical protein